MKSKKIGKGRWVLGDCLEAMSKIPDSSVDLILCDLPYGTTACSWDIVIPFKDLWEQYRRILTNKGNIILSGSQPFSSLAITSNLEWFKYALVWEKNRPTGHVHAKNKPMKKHEDILLFSPCVTAHASLSSNRMLYKPQGLMKLDKPAKSNIGGSSVVMAKRPSHRETVRTHKGYPDSILRFDTDKYRIHPTQKPVALFEYLIKTYSNPGMLVLDNCAGSGTTAIAAENTGRKWICVEKDKDYSIKACNRIREHLNA